MIEVEVKAHLTDFKEIKIKLSSIGAREVRTEYQEDIYFNAPHRDFAQTDEALRIRKVTSKGGFEIILTYKGAKLDELSKTREEIEVNIEDLENTKLILEKLGFKPVRPVKKDRIFYTINEYIITLDTVHEVGNFVEIEKDLNEGADYQESLDEIFRLYLKLGVTDGFERRSYLELLESSPQ
jgi:adenylate cyclase class 2